MILRAAPIVAFLFRTAALATIVLAVFAPHFIARPLPPELVVVLDRSQSVPAASSLAAWRELKDTQPSYALKTLEFAGNRRWLDAAAPAPAASAAIAPGMTDIAAALDAALAGAQARAAAGMVLVSDGHSLSNPERALQAIGAAGIPLCWMPVGRASPPLQFIAVQAPPVAKTGVPFDVALSLEAADARTVEVSIAGSDGGHAVATFDAKPGGATRSVSYTATRSGPLLLTVAAHTAHEPNGPGISGHEAMVEVEGPARTLYVGRAAAPLAASLSRGGWPVQIVTPSGAPTSSDTLGRYQAVILDDVAASDASTQFWNSLVQDVAEKGVGLIVLGGPNSFAAGGYAHSVLESILPVLSEPDVGKQTEAVAFVVDKSGSMGTSSAGVNRLRAARSAVIEAARELNSDDEVLLAAFDVEPRLLVPLAPYGRARATLEAPWPIQAAGGTQIGPALSFAAERLAGAVSDAHWCS